MYTRSGDHVSVTPFSQGRFEDLPTLPRVPHCYQDTEQLEVRVRSKNFGHMTAHVRTYGSGPPLLLIHGFMTTSYSWRYAFAHLGKHYTCYAPDLPGAGRSGKPLNPSYEPAEFATWLGELQRELGIYGCKTVGNSMGGYLGMHLALAEPKAMSKLVVLHAPGIPELRLEAARQVFKLPGTERLFHWLVRRAPLRWAHKNVHYYDESLKSLEEAHEYGDPLDSYVGAQAFLKHLRETMGIGPMKRFVAQLENSRGTSFPVPLLLMYARQDPMVSPKIGTKLHELIPSAQFQWLEHASHFAHVDSAEQFSQGALAFLDAPSDPGNTIQEDPPGFPVLPRE